MKKGILVVSFGTSYSKTRALTIDAVQDTIQKSYPHIPFYRAWTSRIIMKKLLKTTGEKIPSVTEALKQMQRDGITDVYIQPTHMINGIENDRMKEEAQAFSEVFSSISFGAPLISSTEDMKKIVRIIENTFSTLPSDEAVVLMGHGSEHHSNAVYPALDYMFSEMGHPNIHVGTVEGYPALRHILSLLEAQNIKKVHLAPLMLVAGDHALHDMAGDTEDSWKSILEKNGYKTTCHIKGLGEYPEIQEMFLLHLSDILQR